MVCAQWRGYEGQFIEMLLSFSTTFSFLAVPELLSVLFSHHSLSPTPLSLSFTLPDFSAFMSAPPPPTRSRACLKLQSRHVVIPSLHSTSFRLSLSLSVFVSLSLSLSLSLSKILLK